MNNRILTLFLLVMGLTCADALAQRQLVLMSGDEVIHRFTKGETFRTRTKDSKAEFWGFLVEIDEFSVITSRDTLSLRDVRKVLVPGKPIAHRMGVKLIKMGVGLFIIDQVNHTLIQHQKMDVDGGVAKASIALTTAGIPLLFFKKNWKKVKGTMRLMSVGRESRFYLIN
jgi:hypothetical protein